MLIYSLKIYPEKIVRNVVIQFCHFESKWHCGCGCALNCFTFSFFVDKIAFTLSAIIVKYAGRGRVFSTMCTFGSSIKDCQSVKTLAIGESKSIDHQSNFISKSALSHKNGRATDFAGWYVGRSKNQHNLYRYIVIRFLIVGFLWTNPQQTSKNIV